MNCIYFVFPSFSGNFPVLFCILLFVSLSFFAIFLFLLFVSLFCNLSFVNDEPTWIEKGLLQLSRGNNGGREKKNNGERRRREKLRSWFSNPSHISKLRKNTHFFAIRYKIPLWQNKYWYTHKWRYRYMYWQTWLENKQTNTNTNTNTERESTQWSYRQASASKKW